jgi:hypothetical protein
LSALELKIPKKYPGSTQFRTEYIVSKLNMGRIELKSRFYGIASAQKLFIICAMCLELIENVRALSVERSNFKKIGWTSTMTLKAARQWRRRRKQMRTGEKSASLRNVTS